MIRPLLAVLLFLTFALPTTTALAETAAKIGSWTLTVADVDAQLEHKLYELREEKVQELVIEHLLELEAKANGISADQVMDKMVNDKIPPLSDQDIKEFIKANKSRLPDGGEGMEDKVRGYLGDQMKKTLQATYLQSLAKKYSVDITLDPPRFTVDGPQDLTKGDINAPITIIEFSDFECPYCRRAQKTIKKVEEKYGDKVRFVFRHFPLPFHKKAPKASEAAQCANDQGAFWPFHKALFAKDARLDVAEFKGLAVKNKLDTTKFNKCLDSGRYAQRVLDDIKAGKKLGITGTPTFFVNGVKLVGAVPFSDFAEVIEQELAK